MIENVDVVGIPMASVRDIGLFGQPKHFYIRLALALCFFGISIALVGKMLLQMDSVLLIGVLMNLFGMFLIVFTAVTPSRRSSLRPTYLPVQNELSAPTTRKLKPMNEADFIPSITESTTNLLKTPVADPSSDKQF